jgi:hypothetical protein
MATATLGARSAASNRRVSGTSSTMSVIQCLGAALLIAAFPHAAAAQTEYYNLDFNRPLRVEDAVPTERRSLAVQLAPLRGESFMGGARRWRADPLLSYGIASLTEIELRLPVLVVQPSDKTAPIALGLTSLGIGGMRALTTETSLVPGTAVSGELLIPVGSLAPPKTSYAIKALLTKTVSAFRVSLNGAYGTYSVVPAPALSPTCRLAPPGTPACNGQPSVPDVPCTRVPQDGPSIERFEAGVAGASYSTACISSNVGAATNAGRSLGDRWFAGAEIDHAFVFSSTLIGADVFAEHLIGLSSLVDWTAEVGLRRQWSPRIVVDAGIARHFAGSRPSTAFTVGVTYALALARHGA